MSSSDGVWITRHRIQGKKIARDLNMSELCKLRQAVVAQVQEHDLKLVVFAELPPERSRLREAEPSMIGREGRWRGRFARL